MSSNWDTDWDLSIHNRNGQRIIDIEVKTKLNASPEWAARFRRNILAHGTFPKAPYFLMVFPDCFYLWTDAIALRKYIKTIAEGSMYTNFYILNADVLTSMRSAITPNQSKANQLTPLMHALFFSLTLNGLELLLSKSAIRA